jgi:hypothetical protein
VKRKNDVHNGKPCGKEMNIIGKVDIDVVVHPRNDHEQVTDQINRFAFPYIEKNGNEEYDDDNILQKQVGNSLGHVYKEEYEQEGNAYRDKIVYKTDTCLLQDIRFRSQVVAYKIFAEKFHWFRKSESN